MYIQQRKDIKLCINIFELNKINFHYSKITKYICLIRVFVISAFTESIAWQIGWVASTRLSKTNCKSSRKSCLKRVIIEASGTLVNPQNSRRCLEYLRKTRSSESVGIEKIRWIISAHKNHVKGIYGIFPLMHRSDSGRNQE